MKRTVSKILVVVMMMTMLFALVSCGGSKSQYVGTWTATEIEAYGMTMTPEEAGMEFTIDIKSDGTITATTNGEDDGAGEWEETETGIKIISQGEEMQAELDDDGNLVLDLYGIKFVMEKQ